MTFQNQAIILLGTNLGQKKRNLLEAINSLSAYNELYAFSKVYETMAWGLTDQDSFLNQVLVLKTNLQPIDLLHFCQNIENKMGRVRKQKWGERIIDIDILYYNQQIIDIEKLQIPHPFLHERRFTLVPLVEIMPNFIHPILLKTQQELLQNCSDSGEVKLYKKPENELF